jgi:hypothetical protein
VQVGGSNHPLRGTQRNGENGIFEPFIYQNDHFAKTGSGQTQGKARTHAVNCQYKLQIKFKLPLYALRLSVYQKGRSRIREKSKSTTVYLSQQMSKGNARSSLPWWHARTHAHIQVARATIGKAVCGLLRLCVVAPLAMPTAVRKSALQFNT